MLSDRSTGDGYANQGGHEYRNSPVLVRDSVRVRTGLGAPLNSLMGMLEVRAMLHDLLDGVLDMLHDMLHGKLDMLYDMLYEKLDMLCDMLHGVFAFLYV